MSSIQPYNTIQGIITSIQPYNTREDSAAWLFGWYMVLPELGYRLQYSACWFLSQRGKWYSILNFYLPCSPPSQNTLAIYIENNVLPPEYLVLFSSSIKFWMMPITGYSSKCDEILNPLFQNIHSEVTAQRWTWWDATSGADLVYICIFLFTNIHGLVGIIQNLWGNKNSIDCLMNEHKIYFTEISQCVLHNFVP